VTARSFVVPKEGNSAEQCDDAVAFSEANGRFAVADGATGSFHSAAWARALVETFVVTPFAFMAGDGRTALDAWLAPLRKAWEAEIDSEWDTLPWYSQRKATRGGHATILTLEIIGNQWTAGAIGDSCLFQLRDGRPLVTFPLADAAQFDTSPDLVSTKVDEPQDRAPRLQTLAGECQEGDVFLLATDALSCLALGERSDDVWRGLATMSDAASFADWVSDVRRERRIWNDDVALIVVEFRTAPLGGTAEVRG
jgi:serine/threonine protein phosphatase PrpC